MVKHAWLPRRGSSSAVTACLQRAGTLRHTVADLAFPDLQGRLKGQVIGGRCGQDCGQRVSPEDWPCADLHAA